MGTSARRSSVVQLLTLAATVGACALPSGCERAAPPAAGAPARDTASTPAAGGQAGKVFSFRATSVDGVDLLTFAGEEATVEHVEGPESDRPRTHVVRSFPRKQGYRAVVRNQRGRAVVRVIEQPTEENGFAVRVFIDDTPYNGGEPLDFDIYAAKSPAPTRPHNVVVITIDTLRRDRLGCYGYERDTTPNIDEFAERCVRFARAHSTSSFTPPSHASIFTSRYVADHGLMTWNPMPDDQITLAEVLKDAGYVTVANVNLAMLSQQNLGQGFDFRTEGLRDGRIILKQALEVVRNPPAEPMFLWLHFYDAHRPYCHDPGWRARYTAEGRRGVGDGEDHYNLLPSDVIEQGLSEADLTYIADRYDAGVAFTDAVLGPLLGALSAAPRRDDTMVVLTADHGENLLEHRQRLFTHDPFLYPVVTDIPMMIRYPGETGAGRVAEATVSLIDIAPTILDTIGLPPPPTFAGLSLTGLTTSDDWARDHVFMECWGWEKRKAVHSGDRLVIHDLKTDLTTYFDLTNDPQCMSAIASPQGARDAALRAQLIKFITERDRATDEPPELDEETIRRLRSLGYVD